VERCDHRLPQRRAGAVGDVGTAVDGPQNTKLAAWEGETPSIILIIFKQPGANVNDTVDHVKASLPRIFAVAVHSGT